MAAAHTEADDELLRHFHRSQDVIHNRSDYSWEAAAVAEMQAAQMRAAVEVEAESDEEESLDLSEMKVSELKSIAEEAGLPQEESKKIRKKSELIEYLESKLD